MQSKSGLSSVTDHYDADYFEWQNEGGTTKGSLNAEHYSCFIKPTDEVLDFGSAGGWILSSIRAARKMGVEINPHARAFATMRGIDTVEKLSDVPDCAFDVVISNHALEHTECPMETVRAMHSKLKAGGIAVVMVPCERFDTLYRSDNIDQHLYTWAPVNIGNLFHHARFDVISVQRVVNRWPPRVELIDRVLGRAVCNFVCRLYSLARPKLTQIRVVARKN
jgi:SAM-dependent methyltransferase